MSDNNNSHSQLSAGFKFDTVAVKIREMSEPVNDLSELETQQYPQENESEGDPLLLRDIPWNVPYFMPEWQPHKKRKTNSAQSRTKKQS